MKRALLFALYFSVGITVLLFFLFQRLDMPLLFLAPEFPLLFIISYAFMLNTPKGIIRKRQREIDKEVLFAGRYLLVKMESGAPLFNSLIDASKGYGVASKYFREIVDEINTGTPIEEALEEAKNYNASEKFRKILWQIMSSLKTGADTTGALRQTLKAIATEQTLEIKEYGKKLNSLMLFYMVLAVVVPSLGMSLFIIMASFLQLKIATGHLVLVVILLSVIQLTFLSIIKATRPLVDL